MQPALTATNPSQQQPVARRHDAPEYERMIARRRNRHPSAIRRFVGYGIVR